jgi:HD-GYP domain-containing protein (c-di-GMP phosphodiesterase class II)
MTHEAAISELMRYSGIQFDPEVVAAFVKLPREVLTGKSNVEEAETEAGELAEVQAG